MIHVKSDREGLTLTMQGHAHAEHNGEGHDLVCCSASILVQTLAYYAQECGHLQVQGRLAKGDAYIHLEPEQGCLGAARIAYTVIERGLEMLQKAYPQHISIEYGYVHPPDKAQ